MYDQKNFRRLERSNFRYRMKFPTKELFKNKKYLTKNFAIKVFRPKQKSVDQK